MFISKRISLLIVVLALLAGASGLIAVPANAQDEKKVTERKLKRTTTEATKGKAKPQSNVISVKQPLVVKKTIVAQQPISVKQPLVVKRTIVAQQPVVTKQPVVAKKSVVVKKTGANQPVTEEYETMPPVDIATLPAPMNAPSDMPTDMPAKLSIALIAMLPSNLQNRVDNIIAASVSNATNMFTNIYLLAWVDDELMKKFNSSDFYSTLLTVISQECNVSYAAIETIATSVRNHIDTMLTNFENAIATGDKSNVNIQQVGDLFRGEDSYPEYLDRCLRLANEYKQPAIATLLKLAIATATANASTPYVPATAEDFNY